MKTLVVGCDASGKSTLVRAMREQYGGASVESSRSEAAIAFKTRHLRTPIDAEFVAQREAFYLRLEAAEQAKTLTLSGNLVTTNATLVTRLAHAVMRTCISEPCMDDSTIISHWLEDERSFGTPLPDQIVLTRAEPDVIRERITARQAAGNQEEAFWGFNAPFFLERYQQRWEGILPALGSLGITCTTVDTSH